METAAAIALLFALANKREGAVSPSAGGDGSGGSPPNTGSTPQDTTLKDIAGVAGAALGLLGSAGVLGGGGGAAAAGGGAAVAGGASLTTGGAVGTGGTAGGAAAGGGGGAAAAAAAGGFVASGAAATSVIVGVIMLFIIADQVNKALETAKDWMGAALALNINAEALNRFEAETIKRYLRTRGQTWTEESVRDFRFDRVIAGQHTKIIGRRRIIRSLPVPNELSDVFPRIRQMGLLYLRWRATYGYRLIKAWRIVANPPPNFGYSADLLGSEYEAQLPGVGNLLGVPFAWQGRTVVPRKDPESVINLDPLELVGATSAYQYPTVTLTDLEVKMAKFAAICDACLVLRWDTRGLDGDPILYAKSLCDALQWNGNTVPGLELRGETIWLDPAEFACGEGVYINPTNIRAGKGGGIREGR